MAANPSGSSPLKSIPATTRANENKKVVDDHLIREFKDTMFEVTYDSFVKAFLYPSPPIPATESPVAKEYALVANKFLEKLSSVVPVASDANLDQGPNQGATSARTRNSTTKKPASVQPDIGPMWYKDDAFYPLQHVATAAEGNPRLKTAELREQVLYEPLIALMTAIQTYFRKNGLSGDENWPQPINPDPRPNASQPKKSKSHLARSFVGCYNQPLDFVSEMVAEPDLKPDLALVLIDDEVVSSTEDSYAWKDIDIGIEVKFDTVFDARAITQVARYARAMKIDQPDRNFFYTLLISKDTCRVFRWDSAGCYVTESLWYHREPEKFIELIGRLAALDPETLGFDLSFSNAGRVHSSYDPDDMRTTLTILPSAVRDLVERDADGRVTIPKPLRPDMLKDQGPRVFVLGGDPVSRIALDYNFGRSTIVWEAWEVIEGQADQGRSYIIKQNYQDDSRPHEGAFYAEANQIRGVGHLAFSQEVEHTREYRQRIALSDITGCWRKVQPTRSVPTPVEKPASPPQEQTQPVKERDPMDRRRRPIKEKMGFMGGKKHLMAPASSTAKGAINSKASPQWKLERSEKAPKVERVLLRFVFEDVGENLAETQDAAQLIGVAHDCLEGVFMSLTCSLARSLTEFGELAIQELWMAGILHRDISFGNLLVMTCEPLRGFIIDLGLAMRVTKDGKANEGSDVHHHLTGTLPFIAADLLPRPGKQRPNHAVGHDIESLFWVLLWTCLMFSGVSQPTEWMFDALDSLNDADPVTVGKNKRDILDEPELIRVKGKYEGATALLQAYAKLCKSPETRTFDDVHKLFNDFKNGRLGLFEDGPQTEPPKSSTLGPSQRKRGFEDEFDNAPRSKRSRGSYSVSLSAVF
ncbi:hypothetical protein FRB94_009794 [Tulasnella sp. JGI-2019a]|nr:hypothetical protein FRB93_009025 [Tulasnella sp. JGI-2019a]KAG8994573.1 hypothetical protein FRB94_009794 [Tulasnella sp. JGI-2019a]